MTETTWPRKMEIFPIWSFIEKFANSCFKEGSRSCLLTLASGLGPRGSSNPDPLEPETQQDVWLDSNQVLRLCIEVWPRGLGREDGRGRRHSAKRPLLLNVFPHLIPKWKDRRPVTLYLSPFQTAHQLFKRTQVLVKSRPKLKS